MTIEDLKQAKQLLYKLSELREFFNISLCTLNKLIDDGKIKSIKIGKCVYITKDEVIKLLTEGI